METNNNNASGIVWYLLGGLVIGAAAGMLLAPKTGSEMRDDILDWRQRNRKRVLSWLSSMGDAIPMRVKTAAAIGAVKNGASETYDMSRDKAKSFIGS